MPVVGETAAVAVTDAAVVGETAPPWPVLAYVPVSLLWVVVAELTDDEAFRPSSLVLGVVLTFAIGYGDVLPEQRRLMVGVFVMVFPVMGASIFLRESTTAGLVQIAGVLSLLILLFHPETLRWFSPWRRSEESQG